METLAYINFSKNQLDDGSFDNQVVTESKEHVKKQGSAPDLDVCFMIDVTGSMQEHIDKAKNKMKDIIKEVNEAYPDSTIRLGIVGYRDIKDAKRFEILPFTTDGEEARDFLDKVKADGGDDFPEDVNGGFRKTLYELVWEEAAAKMIIHIADAPCHGNDFHTNRYDDYPTGHAEDKPYDEMFG
jgi:hypothetical protein